MTNSAAQAAVTVRGFVLQATYRVQHGVPVVYVFGRLEDGSTFQIRDNRQRPHFLIRDQDQPALASLRNLKFNCLADPRRNFVGEGMLRIEVPIPADAPQVRDALHRLGVATYEADVRFAQRYLIDRSIKGGIQISGAVRAGQGSDWIFENPEVASADVTAAPRVLSFDIETDPHAPGGDRLLAIACYGLGVDEVVVVDRAERPMPPGAVGVPTEKDALHYFAELVRRLDVDVLTGWNVIDFDLSVLQKVATRVRYDLQLGREAGRMRIRAAEGYFGSGQATLAGRLVVDGLDLVRGAFLKLDEYSLQAVSAEVLGEGKTFTSSGSDKVADILRSHQQDLPAFTLYARTDARLALQILEKLDLIELAFARSALTGMSADRVAASIASFDFLYPSALHQRGLAAPSVAEPGANRVSQGGGAVFEPQVGMHKNVWVCDFKSLYPSIMRTFNIDPLGYVQAAQGADAINTQDGTGFARQPGILPAMLNDLFDERAAAKQRGDGVASQAIKILMNSFYGVLGTPACRFYNPHIANAITSQGRFLLHWSRQWFESRGYRVLYGDTDSVFVASGEADAAQATSVGDDLVRAFNLELAEFLSVEYQVESRLELEFEKLYSRLFLASTRSGKQGARKRYAGIRYQAGADANSDEIEFVGMEVVRRDWTELAKQVQRNLYQRLFAGADVTAYLSEVANLLRDGALDEQLVYRKGLRKSVDAYTTNVPPHVQAVRKSKQPPPRVVRYVMTRQGPELAAEQVHELDREHYLQRQVRPVAEPVLQALHLEFDKVVGDDRQISLF